MSETPPILLNWCEHIDGLIIDEWRDGKWFAVADAHPLSDGISLDSSVEPSASLPGQVADAAGSEHEEDELGVLDYMAAFHDASEALSEVMKAIAEETERVGDEIRSRAAETDAINERLKEVKALGGSRRQQEFLAQARANVDRAAGNLDDFTAAMTPNVERFRVQNRAVFENMRLAFRTGSEFGTRDTSEDRAALAGLIPIVHASRESAMGFQASISRVPALTGHFKRSRKRAAAILGEMIAEMSVSIQEARSLLDEMGGPPDVTPPPPAA
ncbi:MAG TPA: hypothetical protein VNJ03_05870 [Vicinamibacterales bacterium]|nr:hypothetical protein [Vicinamibacterales bacterium]